jgi:REP element-mobilizing transposase RayT
MARRGRKNLSDEHFFFVTTTVVQFINIFSEDKYCDLLIDNIKHYREKYKFNILAYVIMPSHFHWIVEVNPKLGTISDVMRDIKKYSAWDILEEIEKTEKHVTEIFNTAAKGYPKQRRKFWISRFDDEVIRNERMYWTKLHYIHNNPVKAGLVNKPEDYKYSSARNYLIEDHSILEVDIEFGGVEMR